MEAFQGSWVPMKIFQGSLVPMKVLKVRRFV